jgi:quinolinate synthase
MTQTHSPRLRTLSSLDSGLPIAGRAAESHIDPSLDLVAEIQKLKKERNAVVLAHYYQDSDVQDVADFLGDSLQLAQAAATTKASVICFCGVHFMAETAKILNPDRVVVVPDLEAGCSLADGCPPGKFRAWKAQHPGAIVVSYINCSAEIKAESDWIVTSSNVEKIVADLPADRPILFAPDKNLGRWVQERTGRHLELWQGSCIVHDTFSERKLVGLKERHPHAKVLAHPECEPHLLRHADYIGSTTNLLRHALASSDTTFIVATETGILHQMQKQAPQKTFIPAPPEANCACNECPHMKKNTLEKTYLALRDLAPELVMDPVLMERARLPIERMLQKSR